MVGFTSDTVARCQLIRPSGCFLQFSILPHPPRREGTLAGRGKHPTELTPKTIGAPLATEGRNQRNPPGGAGDSTERSPALSLRPSPARVQNVRLS